MYLTQTNYIWHLPKNQYEAILEMCTYANNLYNVGLYQIRQHFFATHQYLRYEENYHLCKDNENYKLLQAGVSQQILRICDCSFQSFFALLSKKKSGGYDKKVHIPHYRTKGGSIYLCCQRTQSISRTDIWLFRWAERLQSNMLILMRFAFLFRNVLQTKRSVRLKYFLYSMAEHWRFITATNRKQSHRLWIPTMR